MSLGLSLALLPSPGQMRSNAFFLFPEVQLQLDREDPTLTIEEGCVRFELEFSTLGHLAGFLEQLAAIKLPGLTGPSGQSQAETTGPTVTGLEG